jgi:predicted transcriptional regulator
MTSKDEHMPAKDKPVGYRASGKTIGVRLPMADAERLQALADAEEVALSTIVRRGIEAEFKRADARAKRASANVE